MGYEAIARADLRPGRRRWASSRRTPSCRRSTRIGTPRRSARRQAVAPAGRRAPVGLPVRRREAALLPDGGGVRRVPVATPTTRSAGCSTTSRRPGSCENTIVVLVSDNGASGEGGPNGSVNENKFFNGIPDDIEREPGRSRRARRAGDLQPLPDGLGMGLQHAVQDVEAVQLRRRHRRSVHHLVAGGHRGPRRDPPPVPPRHRHRADDATTASASSCPRWSRASRRSRSRA